MSQASHNRYGNPRRWWSREKVSIWLSDQWCIGCGARIEQKTPTKMDGKMLGLNPSKSNGFQIGWTRYPRPKGRVSLQSNIEVQIHAFTRIGIVTASRMLVWKIIQTIAFNIRDGGDAKKWVQESSELTEELVDPESTKKSGPSQRPRGKWKDTIIVSA